MLVGLNGFKGSGKDTVGNYLVEEYGFERLSFAAKLKDSAAALFNIDPILWEVWKNDPDARVVLSNRAGKILNRTTPISVREFLQRYGTEAHRDIFGQDFWIDYAVKGIDPNKNYVFTDARFENELTKIKQLGGYNAQVVRSSVNNEDTHVSEVPPPLHLIDYKIENDHGFAELWDRVDEFIEFLELESYATN